MPVTRGPGPSDAAGGAVAVATLAVLWQIALIEPGRAGAYLALFSEIGFVLLVTTLGGTLLGYWIGGQLNSIPLFAIAGFLGRAGIGAFGIYRLVTRFLARFE